jgi:hypothetical protein
VLLLVDHPGQLARERPHRDPLVAHPRRGDRVLVGDRLELVDALEQIGEAMRVEDDADQIRPRGLVLADELLGQHLAVAGQLQPQHHHPRPRLAQLRPQASELRSLDVERVLDPGQPRLHVVDAPLEAVDPAAVGVDLCLQRAIARARCIDLALQIRPHRGSRERACREQAEDDRERARPELHGRRR